MTDKIDFDALARGHQAGEITSEALMQAVALGMLLDAAQGMNEAAQRVLDASELLTRAKEFAFEFDQDGNGLITQVRAIAKPQEGGKR